MISITSDIDWASETIIEHMVNILYKFNHKCTFFATHKSDILKKLNDEKYEVSIHPNFNKILFENETLSPNKVVSDLLNIYPKSIGVRSHSMTQSSPLLKLFAESSLKYDSNQFLPYDFDIKPYRCWTGLLRIPYNWEDDIHYMYGKTFKKLFIKDIDLKDCNVIMDFHPTHVYLNTFSYEHHNYCRKYFNDPLKLKKCINYKYKGVRDYFIEVLTYLNEINEECKLLKEIYYENRNNRQI